MICFLLGVIGVLLGVIVVLTHAYMKVENKLDHLMEKYIKDLDTFIELMQPPNLDNDHYLKKVEDFWREWS